MTVHGAPPAGASLAHLAERCAAAAAEVAAGAGSLSRLSAAADELDVALGRAGETGAASSPPGGTRDAAGDLLVALSAAGLDAAERRTLADALARLLREVAHDLTRGVPAEPGPVPDLPPIPWQVNGGSAH